MSEGYWELKQISEGKETVKGDDLEEYGLDEAYIVTEKDGEGYAVLFGVPVSFEINEKKGNMKFSTGDVDYKVSGKKLTLSDSNVSMVFEKSKDDVPSKPEEVALLSYSPTGSDPDDIWGDWDNWDIDLDNTDLFGEDVDNKENEDEGSADDLYHLSYSKPREYFEGDWYGWMKVDARTDFWKEIDGEVYDAMCRVEMDDDTFGTMTIFDAGMPYEKPIAKMPIVVSEDGINPKIGCIQSDAGGTFLDGEVTNTTWASDPGATEWKNYMMIAATYVDGKGEDAFDYVFHFKKWGDDWSDFSQKPPHFDWYKKLIDAGEPMPAAPPED